MAVTHSTASKDAATNAVVDQLDGAGSLLVFRVTGSSVASPGTEVATLTFATPAFGASSAGVATAGTITQDSSATGGVVAFASLETSGNVIAIHCAVGTSGSDINIPSGLTIAATDIVTCTSLTYAALSA
jgi:hypothetical protein